MNNPEQLPQPADDRSAAAFETRMTDQDLVKEAWSSWTGYMGADNIEAAAQTFQTSYLGYYTSQDKFTQETLNQLGVPEILDDLHRTLPDAVKPYFTFDVEAYEAGLVEQYYSARSRDGGVHVFKI